MRLVSTTPSSSCDSSPMCRIAWTCNRASRRSVRWLTTVPPRVSLTWRSLRATTGKNWSSRWSEPLPVPRGWCGSCASALTNRSSVRRWRSCFWERHWTGPSSGRSYERLHGRAKFMGIQILVVGWGHVLTPLRPASWRPRLFLWPE